MIHLTVTVPVEKFADIEPSLVRFNGPVGSDMKQQVQVVPGETTPFKITGSSAREGKNIRFEVKETTVSDRPAYVVDVENTKTNAGSYQDMIYLETDNKQQTKITIRVFGSIYDLSLVEDEQPEPESTQNENAGH